MRACVRAVRCAYAIERRRDPMLARDVATRPGDSGRPYHGTALHFLPRP